MARAFLILALISVLAVGWFVGTLISFIALFGQYWD